MPATLRRAPHGRPDIASTDNADNALPPGRAGDAPLPAPFAGEHGPLPFRHARYEVVGNADEPAVVVLGGISATRHATAHRGDARPGWWQEQVGPGRAIDTDRFLVICVDYLGHELAPGDDVPRISTGDQARAVAAVLDALGIARVRAFVGASYGGMVALAFAACFPDRLDHLVVLGAAHEPHPMATALRTIQRQILRLGQSAGRTDEGLALARALAMTTYRTADEMAARFASAPEWSDGEARFPVESYLAACGWKYVESYTPGRFLALSESIDLHRVDPASIPVSATLVAFEGDAVCPPWQVRALAARLPASTEVHDVASMYGHDAFLKETQAVSAILTHALDPETRA